MIGIYYIQCLKTKRKYVGSSNNIEKRWKRHLRELKSNSHCNSFLQRTYNKYGSDNLIFVVLEILDNIDLSEKEMYYISKLKTLDRKHGFNLTTPLTHPSIKASEEYRKRISVRMKGNMPSNISILREKQRRAVDLYIDGKYSQTFESGYEAERQLGLRSKSVNDILRGQVKKLRSHPTYFFKYSDGNSTREIKK